MSFLDDRWLIGALLCIIFIWEWRQGYFRHFPAHLREEASSRLLRQKLLWGLLIPFLILLDQPLHTLLMNTSHQALDLLKSFGKILSKNRHVWLVMIGIYGAGFGMKSRKLQEASLGALLTSGLTGLLVTGLKFTFLRARPYSYLGPYSFFNFDGLFQDAHAFQSMPSGDVGIIAGFTSYWFLRLKKGGLRWALFLLPLSTALGRIDDDKHWPSDTLAALLISLLAAKLICEYQKLKASRSAT